MIKQLISQALNGFSLVDLPFLILQLSVSAFLAIILRMIWQKKHSNSENDVLLKYLVPLQIILTLVAIFSLQSPWMIVLFGFIAIMPLLGSSNLEAKTKVFYTIVVVLAFGCGAANLFVTSLIILLVIIPLLYLIK